MSKLIFPKGFYWGAATSSHQVEGNNYNDWSKWEKENAERLAKEAESKFGRLSNWKDIKEKATNPNNYISGLACDHYHRYEQDFDMAKSLYHNAHRFSLEWSRIEPEEGKFDAEALEHYKQIVTALRTRDIEPFVTLWHWTLPLWLAEKGGIGYKEFPQYFERYTEKVIEVLGSDVKFWITLNEPDVISAHAYMRGVWPPQKKSFFLLFKVIYTLKRAHKRSYTVIKKHFPSAQVGIAKHQVAFNIAHPTLINRFIKHISDWLWNKHFLNLIKDQQDFIGVNHYNRNVIDKGFYNRQQSSILTDIGWEYWPDSIYQALIELKSYGKPIYITENGLADEKDILRKMFLRTSIAAVHQALSEGVDIRGYLHWSLLDNFEWDKGFWPCFGLIAVDFTTQIRTPRPSALFYAEICKNNSLDE